MGDTTIIVRTPSHVFPQLFHFTAVRGHLTFVTIKGTFRRVMQQKEPLLLMLDADFPFGIIRILELQVEV